MRPVSVAQRRRLARLRAALRTWDRRFEPGRRFTAAQRDLLLEAGYLAPVVPPLPRRRRP